MSNKVSVLSMRALKVSVLSASLVAAFMATICNERDAEAYTWASATVSGQTIFVPNLSSLGANSVTIAPVDRINFYLLGRTTGFSNYEAYKCGWNGTSEYCSSESQYFWSLAYGYGATPYSLTTAGYTWSKIAGTWSKKWASLTGVYWASVAPTAADAGYVTDGDDTGCSSTTPSGSCIYSWTTGNSPSAWHFGADQVTVDSRNGNLYALGSNNVAYGITTTGTPTATAIPTCIIGGGTLVADQIAAKGGIVFAISDNSGSGGTVYWFNYSTSSCWTKVGAKSNFALSIATDPISGQTGSGSNGYAVWGTDNNNTIWFACDATSCTAPW